MGNTHTHTQESFPLTAAYTQRFMALVVIATGLFFPNLHCNVISITAAVVMGREAESAVTGALIAACRRHPGEVLHAKWLNTLLKKIKIK